MASKSTDCYSNLLYTMEDVAVYGYITPLKVKIIIALAMTDSVVRDADVLTVRPISIFDSPPAVFTSSRPADIPCTSYGISSCSCQPLFEAQSTNRRP